MKKFIALCLVLIIIFVIVCPSQVFADPMTLSQIASIGYAFGSSFGFTFGIDGLTSEGANTYLSGMINRWLAGRTIAEVFGITPAQIIAGKLIVPAQIINALRDFYNSFIADNDINASEKEISCTSGGYSYIYGGIQVDKSESSNDRVYYYKVSLDTGETTEILGPGWGRSSRYSGIFNGFQKSGRYIQGSFSRTRDGSVISTAITDLGIAGDTKQTVTAKVIGDVPDVLNPDKDWSGTIGGEDWPDTNLDELLGHIDEMVVDGTLEVEGEIVDPPVPPTPIPTIAPDTPLQDVPWEGLNDLIGSSAGTIADGIKDQTDDITGAQEATTEAVESLTETIEGALDTPNSEDLPKFKFDLRELFPFCIPFDIYRLLSSFDAEPAAPHVQLPIVIDSIGFSYMLDLDFSAWNPVAQAMRTAELIVYAIGLAWATGKVIKW